MALENKISFEGRILGVQPRIRLTRSFDQRHHSYLGYMLRINGSIGGETGDFVIGIGKETELKYGIQADDNIRGKCAHVEDPRLESVMFYKVSAIEIYNRAVGTTQVHPPWYGVPPALEVYRERGHRRLDQKTYNAKCTCCIWGCLMPVEMIIDQWNPTKRRYRLETFCYGPKSCIFYNTGRKRTVPGRNQMSWTEEDWIDEDATSHRGIDE